MKAQRQQRPQVESLEAMVLLSGLPTTAHHALVHHAVVQHHKAHHSVRHHAVVRHRAALKVTTNPTVPPAPVVTAPSNPQPTAPTTPPPTQPAPVPSNPNVPINFSGNAWGTYTASTSSDGVKSYVFSGSGNISPAGSLSVSGGVQLPPYASQTSPNGPSPVVSGNALGRLVLSNASGSISLTLVGAPVDIASRHPDTFQYTITASTGQFQGVAATGSVVIGVNPTSQGASEQGTFVMSFLNSSTPAPP